MRRWGVFALALLTAALVSSELRLSVPIFGTGPDIVLLVVVAFASGERRSAATGTGFVAGVFRDLLLTSPRGISAFAYGLTAYAVSLAGEVRGVWATIALVAGATFVSQALFGFGVLLLSQNASISALPRVALATTAYNTLLAPLLMPVLRRFAAPERQAALREGGPN